MNVRYRVSSWFLLATVVVATSCPVSHAADLVWSGNGTTLGGTGSWNATLTRWGTSAAGPFSSGWTNANLDTAVFSGTAGTVTLTAPITVGGLTFSTNSGYSIVAGTQGLTFNGTNNTIGLINQSGTTSTVTISGTVGGTGNVTLTSIAADVGSTLTLNGTSTSGWNGTTTVGPGATLSLAQSNQGLLTTSGITLNGGAITLTNTNTGSENTINRISDSAGISAQGGGTLTYTNTATANRSYTETIGAVDLVNGQLNFALTNNQSLSGNNQTLTLAGAGLTRTGASNTSSVTFSSGGGLNTTTNRIFVTGSGTTTGWTDGNSANSIIGPWATVGTAVNAQTDYAVYSGNYTVSANTTASANNTWTDSTKQYTSGSAAVALGSNLTMAALRNTSANATITLSNGASGYTLATNGILNGATTLLTIAPGTVPGSLTAPGASGGNIYLTAGSGAMTISANITNNGGSVGVITGGTGGNLTLSGTNTYTGGTVLNSGTLAIGNVNNIGGAGGNLTFGGTATLAPSGALNFSTGTLNVGSGAYGTIANTTAAATAFQTTTGAGTLRYLSGSSTNTLTLGNASAFTGNLEFRLNGNAGYGQTGVILFSSLGESAGSVLQIGGGQSDATFPGQRAGITFNGTAPLTFNQRVVQLLPRTASNHTVNTTTLYNNSATANVTWIINTNLSNLNIDTRSFELAGTNTGNNAFNGVISNGMAGGTINFRKDGSGTWILGGANTYTGTTSVITGTLKVGNATALGASSGVVTVSSGAALDLNGTTMTNTNPLTISGTGISNGGALTNSSSTSGTYAGLITLNASGTSIVASSGNVTLSNTGTIAGNATGYGLILGGSATGSSMASAFNGGTTGTPGAGTLTKQGSGTWALSGTNTYGGKTIIQAGTLSFSVGDASATADQQLGKNAALDLGVAATSSGRLLYTGGTGTLAKNINALGNGSDTIQNSGSGLLTLSGTITKNGTTLTLNGGANGIDITGGITGTSFNSDLIIDSGTTTLSVASTYNGPTFIRSTASAGTGILNANVINALPTSINRTAVTMDDSGLGGSQLNLGASQSIASLTGAVSSLVNLNANTLTVGTASGSTTFAGVISGSGSLTKDGASILTLTNTNTYNGTTTVTGGILRVDGPGSISTGAVNVSAGALGGANGTINGAVTLSGTGGMNLAAGVVGDLTLTSTLDITGSAGANSLSFDLGSGANGTDKIIVSGAPTVSNNGVVVAFNQIGGSAARINAGTYTIIQGTSAPTLANYALATTKAFGNTYQLQVTGNNLEVVTTQAATGPTTAFWSGATNASWATLSNNWKTTANSTINVGSLPAYNTDVTFGTTSPTQGNLTTTLGDDFNINSLTFTIPATGGITVGGANMLTLESSGTAITSSNTSGNNTISANVGMAASQSWSVASGGGLLVSGNVTDFGAARSLTKTGAGTLTLSGSNSYLGGTTLSAGTLSVGSANAIPSSGTITIGAGTTIRSSSSAARSFSNAVSIGGDFTVGGSGNLTFSNTGAIALGANRTITVSTSGVNGAFAQSFTGSGFGITKAGAGTLTLSGANAYTGATNISAGTVVLNNDGDVTGSTVTFNGSNSGLTITGGSTVTSIWNNNGGNFGGLTGNSQNNVQVLIDGAGTEGSARVTNVAILNWGGGTNSMTNSTLTITNGGQMNVSGEIRLGSTYYQTAGGANMTIGGVGDTAISTFTGNSGSAFYIGYGDREGANNNIVTVNSNGVLTGIGSMVLGQVNNSQGAGGVATANRLTVTGTGNASMTNVTVGYAQSGDAQGTSNANVVQVTNGGQLTTSSGTNYIGRNAIAVAGATSNSNTLTVTGVGSIWNAVNQDIIVGSAVASATANNNVLTVGAGGVVSNVNNLTVGSGAGTRTGNQLVVDGDLTAVTTAIAAGSTLSGSGNLTSNVTYTSSANSTFAGNIAGSGRTLAMNGTGATLTLNGTNTYTGTTTITAGTLQLGSGASAGSLATTSTITNNGTLIFNRSNAVTQGTDFANTIGGTGVVVQSGSNVLTLSGTNNYAGGTTLNAGTIAFGSGSLGTTGNITFAGASTLQWSSGNTQDVSSRIVMTNGVASTFDTNGNTVNFGSALGSSSTGSLTKIGAGTLIIGGTSSYSGATTITGGTLQVDGSIAAASTVAIGTAGVLSGNGTINGNATLTGSGVINKSAGTIAGTLDVTGGNWNGAGSVTGLVTSSSGTFTIGSGANLTANGDLNVTGGSFAAVDDTSTITGSVNYTSGSNSTFAGIIAGSAKTLTLNNAAATLTLTGNNTYTGATTVTAGTLVVTGSLASSGVTNNTAMIFNSGALQTYSNDIGGSGTLTKEGTGKLILGGTNSYAGLTTVNGGTLAVNGSIVSALLVNAGATFGGTGTVNGAATIQGIHGPGNSPGIQTFGSDLAYSGGNASVSWELIDNTTTNQANPNAVYDQIIVGGNLTFADPTVLNLSFNGANSTVSWNSTFWDTDQTWTLHDVAGTTSGFGNFTLNTTDWLDSTSATLSSVRSSASFNVSQSGQDILINYVAVPEPATMVIFGSAVALLGFRLARRRKG